MFKIYIGDKYGYGDIKVKTSSKQEAIEEAKKYIKAWKLEEAYIDYIEKVEE